MYCTGLGRALRACADNPTAARLMGINVPRMTLLSFGMAAMIAAIGGVVVAPITSLQFDTGRLFTISGFIAVAIGGIQSFVGAILGGLALGVIEQLAAAYVSSLFANTLALGLLLVALLWRPNGLFVIGVARRQDVRENPRVHQEVIRVLGRRAWVSAAVALVVVVALPWLPSGGEILPSLVITAILFMAVLGLDVSMGWGGQVNLGQAGFMAVGGYTAAILATRYDLPPVVGTLAGLVLSLICALMLSLVTMRLRGLYLALATLAFGLLVDSLSVGLTEITGGPSGLVGIPSFAIGDWSFDSPLSMYYLVVALDVVAVLEFRAGAAGHPHRPDGGGGAGRQRAGLQAGGVPHQRRAGLAVGQPLRLLLPLPVARDAGLAAVAGNGSDAGDRWRGHPGGAGAGGGAADHAADGVPAAGAVQDLRQRCLAGAVVPVHATGAVRRGGQAVTEDRAAA